MNREVVVSMFFGYFKNLLFHVCKEMNYCRRVWGTVVDEFSFVRVGTNFFPLYVSLSTSLLHCILI